MKTPIRCEFCGLFTSGACKGLSTLSPREKKCAFKMSKYEAKEKEAKANARIASLPENEQAYIAKTYYSGQRPWLEMQR